MVDDQAPRNLKSYSILIGNAGWLPGQISMMPDARLDDGKLLRCGMKRVDVMAVAGEHLSKDIDTLGTDTGAPVKGETTETWSYRLQGDIGGEYLVSLTLKAGKVVAISSKQLERI